jgi:flagellar hook-associated protein 3 FlgL
MRTTFNAMYRDAAAGIAAAAERRVEFQRQVATGKRLNRLSDDPSSAATAITERAGIGAVEHYTRAATSVGARLLVVDTVIADVVAQLTSASSAVAAARGTEQSQAQRNAAALQIEAARDAIFDDLNTKFDGAHVFAGAASDAPPFVKNASGVVQPYAGSSVEVQVDIDRTRAVTVSFDGSQIAQGASAQDVFEVLDELAAAARDGDTGVLNAGLAKLDAVFQRAVTAQSRLGAALGTVDDQKLRLAQAKIAAAERLDKAEAANLAEAITGMTQADAAYQAALGAAGAVTRVSLMDYLK